MFSRSCPEGSSSPGVSLLSQVLQVAALDDYPADDFRPCQHTRLHDDALGRVTVERDLDQGEIEVKTAVALHELHDVLHAFADPVADDEQAGTRRA